MKIKVGKIPGRTQVVELNEGATIADALRAADLSVSGYELRLSGQVTDDFNKTVSDGDMVLLAQKIKGNWSDGYELDSEPEYNEEDEDDDEDTEYWNDDEFDTDYSVVIAYLNGEEYAVTKDSTVSDLIACAELDLNEITSKQTQVTIRNENDEIIANYPESKYEDIELKNGYQYTIVEAPEEVNTQMSAIEDTITNSLFKLVYEDDTVSIKVSNNTVVVETNDYRVSLKH